GLELYASAHADACHVVDAALVLGSDFVAPLSPGARFLVAFRLMLLRERLGPLALLEDEELMTYFAACTRVAELPTPRGLEAVAPSRLEERARMLGKAMSRRERKALQTIAADLVDVGDVAAWRRAVLDGAACIALAVGGDLGVAARELGLSPQAANARR